MQVLHQLDRIALDLEATHPADIPFQDYCEELQHLFQELLMLERSGTANGEPGCRDAGWARLVASAERRLERAVSLGQVVDVAERRAVLKQATMELHFIADYLSPSEQAS
jgi:hypothetical protein